MLSRRRRLGQPSYAPLATDAQMLLLVLLAARMPRRLPNRARQILPCLEMPATARMSAFARRAAHGECKMGSFGQTQVKLRVRLAFGNLAWRCIRHVGSSSLLQAIRAASRVLS